MLESDDEPDEDSSDLEFDSDFKGEAIFVWNKKYSFIMGLKKIFQRQKCLTVEKAP